MLGPLVNGIACFGKPLDMSPFASVKHTVVQGGNVLHGAMMGLLSAGSGEGMMALGGSLKTGMKVALQSVIGGTLSELGGGNFANGAITAAFSFLFNHTLHRRFSHSKMEEIISQVYSEYRKSMEKYDVRDLFRAIGGELSVMADYPALHDCAMRLSYALNQAGFKIPSQKGVTFKGKNGDNYIIKASEMSKYLRKCFGEPTVLITTGINDIKTALYFQTGFKNVSGHVDVIYNGNVGKKMYPNMKTYFWY